MQAKTTMRFVLKSKIIYYALEKDQLPSSDEYEKLKPEFENHMCFYELSDLSNESSELVRILKECVAEAE